MKAKQAGLLLVLMPIAYLWNNFARRFGIEVCHHPIQAYSMIIAEKSYYKLKQTKNVGLDG